MLRLRINTRGLGAGLHCFVRLTHNFDWLLSRFSARLLQLACVTTTFREIIHPATHPHHSSNSKIPLPPTMIASNTQSTPLHISSPPHHHTLDFQVDSFECLSLSTLDEFDYGMLSSMLEAASTLEEEGSDSGRSNAVADSDTRVGYGQYCIIS